MSLINFLLLRLSDASAPTNPPTVTNVCSLILFPAQAAVEEENSSAWWRHRCVQRIT